MGGIFKWVFEAIRESDQIFMLNTHFFVLMLFYNKGTQISNKRSK